MSPPEVLLWSELRGSKMGFKVRRQHPIGPYIADFFVRDRGLVIEVDGTGHEYGDRPTRDEVRDCYMRELGYRIIRISAHDVMRNLNDAICHIVEQVNNPLYHPSDGPPPHSGEDR